MAARERWAGSSCSHALEDYQDPPLKGRFLVPHQCGEMEGESAKPRSRGAWSYSVDLAALGWLGNRSSWARVTLGLLNYSMVLCS